MFFFVCFFSASAVANNAILGLTKEEIWMTEKWENLEAVCSTGDYKPLDRVNIQGFDYFFPSYP